MRALLGLALSGFMTVFTAAASDFSARAYRPLYEHLHRNPELSFKETETAKLLAEKLKAYGFEVTEKIGQTGVVGVLKNGSDRAVWVRTDMDALPIDEQTGVAFKSAHEGVMHACGHDFHMTVWLAVAEWFSKHRDAWKGTLVMIAQPAEELGQGAKAMIEDGLLKRFPKPAAFLALHDTPMLEPGQIGVTEGPTYAQVNDVDILVRGKGGHAAQPQAAIDPIVLASHLVLQLQEIVSRETTPGESAVVTVGKISAGTKRNIIPNEAALELSVRSFSAEQRDRILKSIRMKAEGVARSYGAPEPEVKLAQKETPAVYNDASLARSTSAGWKKDLPKLEVLTLKPQTVGEDFSQYRLNGKNAPSFMFAVGVGRALKDATGLHHARFLPKFDEAFPVAAEAMTSAVRSALSASGN